MDYITGLVNNYKINENNKCSLCLNLEKNESINNDYFYSFKNNICDYKVIFQFSNYSQELNLLCDYYKKNNNIYIKKCCYDNIFPYIQQQMGQFKEIFITSTLDFSNYVQIKLLNEYCFEIHFGMGQTVNSLKINYLGNEKMINN